MWNLEIDDDDHDESEEAVVFATNRVLAALLKDLVCQYIILYSGVILILF